MSVIGPPADIVLVEARANYLPASDPADPHAWSIVIEDFDDAPLGRTGLKVTWSCAWCRMGVLVEVRVLIEHVLASPGPMKERVVRRSWPPGTKARRSTRAAPSSGRRYRSCSHRS